MLLLVPHIWKSPIPSWYAIILSRKLTNNLKYAVAKNDIRYRVWLYSGRSRCPQQTQLIIWNKKMLHDKIITTVLRWFVGTCDWPIIITCLFCWQALSGTVNLWPVLLQYRLWRQTIVPIHILYLRDNSQTISAGVMKPFFSLWYITVHNTISGINWSQGAEYNIMRFRAKAETKASNKFKPSDVYILMIWVRMDSSSDLHLFATKRLSGPMVTYCPLHL